MAENPWLTAAMVEKESWGRRREREREREREKGEGDRQGLPGTQRTLLTYIQTSARTYVRTILT